MHTGENLAFRVKNAMVLQLILLLRYSSLMINIKKFEFMRAIRRIPVYRTSWTKTRASRNKTLEREMETNYRVRKVGRVLIMLSKSLDFAVTSSQKFRTILE